MFYMYKYYIFTYVLCTIINYLLYKITFTCTCNTFIDFGQQVTASVETLKNDKSDGKHASRTHKHCRPCVMHAHDTQVRAHTCLHGLFSVEHSYQPGTFQCTSSCNNTLRCRWVPSTTTQITSCLRSDGQHAPRTH